MSDSAPDDGSGDPQPPESEPEPAPSSAPISAPPSSSAPLSTGEPSGDAPPGYRPSYVFLIVVTLINLGADAWSKWWAKSHFEAARLAGQRRVVVIEDFMNFIFAKNRGGAWGLLQNENESLRRPFFLIVSVAAIVFIVSLYRKLQPGQRALKWGLPLVLGGALGNLVDRIQLGYVVDFVDVYITWGGQVKHWPTFNVADIAICVGVGLMAIDMFSPRKKAAEAQGEEKKEPDPPSADASAPKPAGADAGPPADDAPSEVPQPGPGS